MRSLEFQAMGSHMLAAVDNDSPAAGERLASVPQWFGVWEDRLSRFRDKSELSALNRSPGQPTQVSQVLWDALQASLAAARFSDGLVSPTLAAWVEAAGYDRTFEELEDDAGDLSRMPAPPDTAAGGIELDSASRRITLTDGRRLDLGGTAKGWAADRAAHRLRALGPCLVDAGGDVAVHGLRQDGRGWAVGISDPFHPGESLDLLCLTHGGVATSGRDFHRWKQQGKWQHHILDPRTGLPAETDVLTATVVAPNTVQAEAAAKVAIILDSERALAWLDDHPQLAGLLVLEDGTIRRSRRLWRYLWR
jgi:FAD:protein FMN transferase